MSTAELIRPSFLKSFSRSQVAAAAATALDYAVLFGLVELFHVWYVIATALGALTGAIANFIVNRHWSFEAHRGHLHGQAARYAIASGLSLILNTGGVYFLTDFGHLHYGLSVIFVSLAVGFFFNYPMHRYFVFK